MKRGCDELGVCQARAASPCAGCEFPFAPGVVQVYQRSRARRVRRIGAAVFTLLALSAGGGMLAGIARAKGWL